MSGVFGMCSLERKNDLERGLRRMGDAMAHTDWSVAQSASSQVSPAGIGHIGIGILNSDPQPLVTQGGKVMLANAGEFYTVDGQPPPADHSHGEVALGLFEKFGPGLVEHVHGAFVIAVVDEAAGRLWILNDRHGLYPLFFAHYDHTFAFAPEMNGVLADPEFPRQLDPVGFLQFLRFQVVLGERTYFDCMQFLDRGSCLEYEWASDRLEVRRYWDFSRIHEVKISFEDSVDTAGSLLLKGIERMTRGSDRVGVYLSGGLDSRTIAAMARRLGRPITTITYGEPGCRDEILARKIARQIGSDHHYMPFLDGSWVEENADLHMALTEGYHGWQHAHGISTLAAARELIDVNLTGWNGGEILHPRSVIQPWCLHDQSLESLAVRIFDLMTTTWQWPGLAEAESNAGLGDALSEDASRILFDSLLEEVRKLDNLRPEMRAYFFVLTHLSRRWTFNILTMLRSHVDVRSPFLDYDFFDFVTSLPRKHFLDRRLHIGIISRFTPEVSLIPDAHELRLPTRRKWIRNTHALFLRSKYRINKHIHPWFNEPPELYADYENYLRSDLKGWAESVLCDSQMVARGLVNGEYVQSLFERHCAGYDRWTLGKIAPFITLELMLQRYFG